MLFRRLVSERCLKKPRAARSPKVRRQRRRHRPPIHFVLWISKMIFLSYSHADARWCQELLTMAAPLTKYGGMQIFSDSDIRAGASWRSTIQKALDQATVAVLL